MLRAEATVRGVLDATPGPVHPAARMTWAAALEEAWADPSARHSAGRRSRAHLDTARAVFADGIGAAVDTVTFHASGEQAMHAAITGLTRARRRAEGRPVTSAVERGTVLRRLQERDPDLVPVDRDGRVDLVAWGAAISPRTPFALLQQANHEVGTDQPLVGAAAATRSAQVPLLVDARSTLGRVDPPQAYDVLVGDAASWGGPGLGVLVVRAGTRVSTWAPPTRYEGGRALDPVDVPRALAAAEAWRQVAATRPADEALTRELTDRFRAAAADVPDVEVPGAATSRLPHVATCSALLTEGELLLEALDARGLAVGSGSACTSETTTPSHVLAAMGALTHGNIRLTLPLPATVVDLEGDVERLCTSLPEVIAQCRERLGTSEL